MFNLLVYGNPQKVLMDKCMVWWICPTTHNKMWAYIAASYSSLCNNPHHAVFMVDVNYDDRNDSTDGVSNFVIGSVAHKTFFGKGGFTCDPKEPIPDWVHQHFVDFMTMHRRYYDGGKRGLSIKTPWDTVAKPNGSQELEPFKVTGGPESDTHGESVYCMYRMVSMLMLMVIVIVIMIDCRQKPLLNGPRYMAPPRWA
jgi:hypothetical protein